VEEEEKSIFFGGVSMLARGALFSRFSAAAEETELNEEEALMALKEKKVRERESELPVPGEESLMPAAESSVDVTNASSLDSTLASVDHSDPSDDFDGSLDLGSMSPSTFSRSEF
jgi:hypothetical protein